MKSPARMHFEKTLAAKQAAAPTGAAAVPAEAGVAAKFRALLGSHKAILKAIQSKVEKANVKRELLPEYEPYVEGVLSAQSGDQDDILVTIMLWRLDAGDIAGALPIAGYALDNGMTMPEGFKSNIAAMILDVITDNEPTDDQLDVLLEAVELTKDHDMPDEVRAKAHKAAGLLLEEKDPVKALDHFKTALEFNSKCGVKGRIDKLEKQIAEASENKASE
ncbi:MAG: hypothetical protein JKY47_03690 [Thalassospira sp.]|uniref:phage terminase small subunit n=1 Tax=Thalassospira sp. 11-3 TaxID=2135614 RepID=UPI000D8D4DAE|nr:phage terminase small subunit [Thalassospira sp. 11-3]MBL4839915.1 hypothetical protein [Thalassospira sp.]PXX30857.1 small terminase subunit [Thalassospira sp. 11-3]